MLSEERYLELAAAIAEERLQQAGRQVVLAIIDELWADYLASVSELKGGIHWISWTGGDPLFKFLSGVQEIYDDFCSSLQEEAADAFATAEIRNGEIHLPKTERFERGATWTYITTDQPFGKLSERILKGFLRRMPSPAGAKKG